ncbi:hypothetical protein TVAG_053010 [Trichomonas vaginalis G3]|uniref:Uncharacterized protein n=1 Tax=Trichomonas vaginalis (strain ATCC PRA-98 / G3) TaxID=412133 RepID=A2F6L3_TRIV3|nr:hypothetical protein TVAG_053010 [Trichomonas vaginalis G3]|eukprot:XP_001312388.1 hypothetical protein [Trichomonas vaginalis G3]
MAQQEDKRWVKAFQAIKREGGDELYKIYVKHLTAGFKKSEFVVKLKEENERILDQLGKANKEIVNLREKLKKYESCGNPAPSKNTTGGYGRQQSKPSANPNVKAEMDKLSKLNDESSKKVKELQAEVDKYKNALLGKGNESEVLVTNLKKVEAEKNTLQSQLTKLSEENTELNHKINEMSMKLKSLDKANEANTNTSQEYINKIELEIYNTRDIIIETITKVLTVVGASQEDFDRTHSNFEQVKNERMNLTTFAGYAKEEIVNQIGGFKNNTRDLFENVNMQLVDILLTFTNFAGYNELSAEIDDTKKDIESSEFTGNTDPIQGIQVLRDTNTKILQKVMNDYNDLRQSANQIIDYYAQVGPGITDKLNQNDGFEKINSTVATIFDRLTQWIQQKLEK